MALWHRGPTRCLLPAVDEWQDFAIKQWPPEHPIFSEPVRLALRPGASWSEDQTSSQPANRPPPRPDTSQISVRPRSSRSGASRRLLSRPSKRRQYIPLLPGGHRPTPCATPQEIDERLHRLEQFASDLGPPHLAEYPLEPRDHAIVPPADALAYIRRG